MAKTLQDHDKAGGQDASISGPSQLPMRQRSVNSSSLGLSMKRSGGYATSKDEIALRRLAQIALRLKQDLPPQSHRGKGSLRLLTATKTMRPRMVQRGGSTFSEEEVIWGDGAVP